MTSFRDWLRARRSDTEYADLLTELEQQLFFQSSLCTIHEIYEWALDSLDGQRQQTLYTAISTYAEL